MDQSTVFQAKDLATLTACSLEGAHEGRLCGVADLKQAGPEDVSFFHVPKLGANGERYRRDLEASDAGLIVISPDCPRPEGQCYLLADDPNQIFQTIIEAFTDLQPRSLGFEEHIHPSAVIHPSAQIDPSARIDPQAVIGQKAVIGPGSIIGAGSIIAAGVRIGCDCLLHPRVTVREGCILHDRVILQPGVVLGGCGFGYRTDERGVHHKLEQRGIVVVEEDVEIGANTTIDRARFGETRIGKGSKIDNQVMLAHGVRIGAHNMIISQSGIAGSTKTGRHVVIAAQVGVMGHIELGDGVQLGARTGVSKSLPSGQYQGAPAMPIRDFQRSIAFIRRGDKRLKALSQRIEALEAKTQSS